MTLQYDCEMEGSVIWTELLFQDVLAVRYCDVAACEANDIVGFDYLVEEKVGGELEALVDRWSFAVGWQESEKQKDTFKTYRVFFDDAAGLVVVARNVSFRSPIFEAVMS